jgi:hypothetical protein
MSAFLTPLWLEDLDGTRWIVCAPFRYQSDLLRGIVVVPVETETDLASVPWLCRGLAPQSGKWNKAAVLHDTAYKGRLFSAHGYRMYVVKRLADGVFLEAMQLSGVNGALARLLYRAVVAFGRKPQGVP